MRHLSLIPSYDLSVYFNPKSSINTAFYNLLRYISFIVRVVVYFGRFRVLKLFVAEPSIPQCVYGSVYKLQNRWFRNTFEHLVMLFLYYSVAPQLFHSSSAAIDTNFPPTLPLTTLHHQHHLTFDPPPPFTILSFLKIKNNIIIY